MKRNYIFLVIGIILVLLFLFRIMKHPSKGKTALAKPAEQAVMAEAMVIRDTLVDFTFRAVGKIRANERVELVSELSRRLVSVHFREGGRVVKGSLMFHLDDAEWKAELQKVKAKLDLARETERRNERLFASGGTSQQILDEAVSQRKILEAEEQYFIVLIEKANIRAPFSGIAGIRNVSEGAYLTPGLVLTVLEDLSRLKLDFTVPEVFAGAIRKGARVSFRVDGITGEQTAVVDATDPSLSVSTGNLRVLAIVENPNPALKAGETVTLILRERNGVPALYVPSQALVPTPGGYHVYILEHGRAGYRKVDTGLRTESMVEVVNGIARGDTLLLTGFMRLRPGSLVKLTKIL
jgi:membrane fusion protein, multidrug efflux system